MMSVYTDIRDLDGLGADTRRGKAMGFVGRTAIHPSQVPVIAAAFAPTDAELSWAGEVLAATEVRRRHDTGVGRDGRSGDATSRRVDPRARRRLGNGSGMIWQ